MKNTVKKPCISCVYFNQCGDSSRVAPCEGRKTKSEQKAEKRADHGKL